MQVPTIHPPARIIPLVSIDEGVVTPTPRAAMGATPPPPPRDDSGPRPPDHPPDGRVEGDGLDIRFRLRVMPTLSELERQYVLHVLVACGGDKSAAASTLGIASSTLYRKLGRYRLSELGYAEAR